MYSIDESILIFLNSFEGLYSQKQLELFEFYEGGKGLLENFAHTKRVDVGGYSLFSRGEITSTDNSLNRD